MSTEQYVLIIDDQVGEILWLLDLLAHRGYEVHVVDNEKDGNAILDAIHRDETSYVAAIFDVMVSTLSIEEIIETQTKLDDQFFEDSKDTGIRLCHRVRELGLNLPVACLTVREDDDIQEMSANLEIPVYHRIPKDESQSIQGFLDEHLPPLPDSKAARAPSTD